MKKGRLKKALTHLALEAANRGKLERPDQTAEVVMGAMQVYVTLLVEQGERVPDPHWEIPGVPEAARLSKRWRRCAWQQARGIVRSWFSNRDRRLPSPFVPRQADATTQPTQPDVHKTI